MKNRTKTNQDREITLCPRAPEVLQAQFALRERMVAAGGRSLPIGTAMRWRCTPMAPSSTSTWS